MLDDLRIAFRQMRRSPGYALVVTVTLALGIGATTAIYSLVHAVLLRPLDHPEPDRIVTLWSSVKQGSRSRVSGPDYRDWAAETRSFSTLAKYRFGGTEAVVVAGVAENIQAAAVSAAFFDLFGVRPIAGRPFGEDDRRTGDAVLVAQTLVVRYFAGDADRALGARIKLLGHLFTIVGVLPTPFSFPERTEIWFPVDTVIPEPHDRGKQSYSVLGRLAPGVSREAAEVEMAGIAARLAAAYPRTNRERGVRIVPLAELLVGQYRSTLWFLLGAVVLVLVIACANIANVLLARNVERRHDIALRAALGAGRLRIARLLLSESLVLSLFGGAFGLLLAHLGLGALLGLAPKRIPGLDRVGLDGSTLSFAAGVTVAVCILVGIFPAIEATRLDVKSTMDASGPRLANRGDRLRSALVIAQLAICLVLLTATGLLLETFARLVGVDPGYRAANLLVLEANHPGRSADDGRKALSFFTELARRAEALPSARAVTYTQTLPIDWAPQEGRYVVDGPATGEASPVARYRPIGPRYFSTLGVPLRSGREIGARDDATAPAVAVINETLARSLLAGTSPLGQRIRMDSRPEMAGWMTIVGVAADTRTTLSGPIPPEVFVSVPQHPISALSLQVVVRTGMEPLLLGENLRQLARALDPEVPIKLTTAEDKIDRTLLEPRFRSVLMAVFAGLALLLAIVGVAGVMACMVAEGRIGFAIRLAVGAHPARIVREVLLHAARLAAFGLAIGVAAAVVASRFLGGIVFGAAAVDARILLLASVLLVGVALGAAAVPAMRAGRTSPMDALRGS
jgi:putative ABC transport system permease protein